MFEQLTQLVQQFGQDAVVNNSEVPNEHNQEVMNTASESILSGLKNIAAQGGTADLATLIQGNNAGDASNPVVQQLTEKLTGDLGEKFGLSSDTASGVAGNLIPQVLSNLVHNAKDPNHKGFEMSDLVGAITGGSGSSGLMDAINQYGGQFGLDQNADGRVDMSDAMAAVSKKGGIGGLLGKLFGR